MSVYQYVCLNVSVLHAHVCERVRLCMCVILICVCGCVGVFIIMCTFHVM